MKCGLNEPDTRRILRYAMAHHIFNEPRKGVVVHTNLSRMLAEDEVMDAWLGSCVEEMWPAAVNVSLVVAGLRALLIGNIRLSLQ